MSSRAGTRAAAHPRKRIGAGVLFAAAIVLVGAMAWDTKVIEVGGEDELQDGSFSAERYGEEQFIRIQASVEERAVDAEELANAIAEDQTAAGSRYGVPTGVAPAIPVRFTGVVGEGRSGIYVVDVRGVPEDLTIRVQTGPAINGTDLRDATGDIGFGQFTNQIEYQNAGSAINEAMKNQVLSEIDASDLSGKNISVTGVFKLVNQKNWLITPVRISVQ
ncbi:DUF2291 family protein [Halotalea alkalilenta]|uniref:DUF2291 domain-containing protein n=1 Tax=Halotalea alkalilenta TaxID=376489 RepID=A0A172YE43_9GAMM|nr:DUF2291 domain-containing protein [Halotalea alkalilenta]ANF57494.1 hypothetical protein A5892_08465 [Halotalea alkalilenta]